MKATLSVPLVGAALLTTGAVYFGLLRCRPSAAGSTRATDGLRPGAGGSTVDTSSGRLLPTLDEPGSFLERLRERGF